MTSKRFQLNKADAVKFGKDALKVLAPYLIVIIPVLISNIDNNWAYSAILLYVLQRIRVALELFIVGK